MCYAHQTRKTTLSAGSPTNTCANRCQKSNPKGNDNKTSNKSSRKISEEDAASAGTRLRAEMTPRTAMHAAANVQPHQSISMQQQQMQLGLTQADEYAVSIRSSA